MAKALTSLNKLLVDGVKYEVIEGDRYEMSLFEEEELHTYLNKLYKVDNVGLDKTIFNYVPVDSDVEREFVSDCVAANEVKFFFKLPRRFKIPTPIGFYIPDWAVLFEQSKRIYFVAETKGNVETQNLRGTEKMKIECGERHFGLFESLGVEYKVATKLKELY